MQKDKSKIYNEIINFLKERNAHKIAVFGSYVREEETAQSDIGENYISMKKDNN